MNNLTPQIKVLLAAMLLAIMFTLSACGDPDAGVVIVEDVVNDTIMQVEQIGDYATTAQDSMETLYEDNVTNGCYSAISNAVDCN